jgi:uncharacterized protein (DUF488 family)
VATVVTIGHGTLDEDALAGLVTGAGIEAVLDVRRFPGSRRHPHVARERIAVWLPERGVAYRWLPALGGRRRPTPDSPNTGLRDEAFRGYADHMATAAFRDGIDALLGEARTRRVATMCAESLWWRCHRRLIADHLVLVEGVAVEHVLPDGRVTPHRPTSEAVVRDSRVVYPGAPTLLDRPPADEPGDRLGGSPPPTRRRRGAGPPP